MNGTPRERAREQTMAEIVQIGRKHLASEGAAALSLRAVARDLGVVSSAVYRYVRSRDELLTLLVIDAYSELADEVDSALGAVPGDDYGRQFRALAWSVRGWALREPARYALLFGSPVPGYHAPAERTTGPGTRVIAALIGVLLRAYQADALQTLSAVRPEMTTGTAAVPSELSADFDAVRSSMGFDLPDELVARGVLIWAALFGAVNFEVFGQYGPTTFSEPVQLFEHHAAILGALVGLR